MASQMRSPLDKNWHLYSLYTLIPDVPALPVMPSRRSVNPDLGAMHRTVHLMDRGPALSVLDHVMVKEVKHEDRLNVQVAGIHRRKLKAAATLGEHDGDDNEDDDDQEDRDYPTAGGDAGDEVSEDSRRSRPAKAVSRRRAQGRRKRRHKQDIRAELPQIPRPQVDLPENFPSSDLLWSILTDTSETLSNSYNILPRLSVTAPTLPPDAVSHFERLAERQAKEEDEVIAAHPNKSAIGRIHHRRVSKPTKNRTKIIGHRETWKNCDRQLEASALVAIGMFLEIAAEEIVKGTILGQSGAELPVSLVQHVAEYPSLASVTRPRKHDRQAARKRLAGESTLSEGVSRATSVVPSESGASEPLPSGPRKRQKTRKQVSVEPERPGDDQAQVEGTRPRRGEIKEKKKHGRPPSRSLIIQRARAASDP